MHSPLFRSGSLLLKTASASLTLGLLTSAAFTRTSSHDRGGKRDNTRLLLLLRRGVHYTFPSLIVHCHARPQSAHTSVVTAGEDHEHNQTRENPAIQQLASGSIVGLFLGLSLRAVSRALVFAVGVSIILFQVCCSGLQLQLREMDTLLLSRHLEVGESYLSWNPSGCLCTGSVSYPANGYVTSSGARREDYDGCSKRTRRSS